MLLVSWNLGFTDITVKSRYLFICVLSYELGLYTVRQQIMFETLLDWFLLSIAFIFERIK